MNDIKSRLLAPTRAAHPVSILGGTYHIRRLSAEEQVEFEEKTEALRDKNDPRGLALLSAAVVLRSLVDEKGTPFADLPTPAELIEVHSHADLVEAVTKVQRHSFGTLEEAEKN